MDAAEALFLKHGFRRVAIDEVCRTAGVSRKTFYVYFENKDALTIELLDKIIGSLTLEFVQMMDSPTSFASKMARMMEMKLALSRRLSMEFLADLFNASSEKVSQFFHKKTAENIAIARSIFTQAQERGEIRSELNIDFVMAIFNNQADLCEKQEFRALFKDSESMMKQLAELLLYGILGNNKSMDLIKD